MPFYICLVSVPPCLLPDSWDVQVALLIPHLQLPIQHGKPVPPLIYTWFLISAPLRVIRSGPHSRHFLLKSTSTRYFGLFCLPSSEFDERWLPVIAEALNASSHWTACSAKALQTASFFGIIYCNLIFFTQSFSLIHNSYCNVPLLQFNKSLARVARYQMFFWSPDGQALPQKTKIGFCLKKAVISRKKYIYQACLAESICVKSILRSIIFFNLSVSLIFCLWVGSEAGRLLRSARATRNCFTRIPQPPLNILL